MDRPRGTGSTTQQLKDDIDSGRTGSKTPKADPGMSALGTDDEAAGRPNAPSAVAAARAQEQRIGAAATRGDAPKTTLPVILVIGAIGLVALVIVFAYILNRG